MKIIGLIRLINAEAFERYRGQVGATIARYGGSVQYRGTTTIMPWNELGCEEFDAYVEIQFPTADHAQQWAKSPEYAALLPIRNQAMRLTLFGVQ